MKGGFSCYLQDLPTEKSIANKGLLYKNITPDRLCVRRSGFVLTSGCTHIPGIEYKGCEMMYGFDVGEIVVFTDAEYHNKFPGCYPAPGTIGEIIKFSDRCKEAQVQWERGSTRGSDLWWCYCYQIEHKLEDFDIAEVEPDTIDILI